MEKIAKLTTENVIFLIRLSAVIVLICGLIAGIAFGNMYQTLSDDYTKEYADYLEKITKYSILYDDEEPPATMYEREWGLASLGAMLGTWAVSGVMSVLVYAAADVLSKLDALVTLKKKEVSQKSLQDTAYTETNI